jgi:glycosyltransferase involved in cell wall biosynthesis
VLFGNVAVNMMSVPTVSVVIPCYNMARYLRDAIHSALKQTLPPLEVIVVDDGSTDDTATIATSFAAPVRTIRQKNQGVSVARNSGMEQARGQWIALLDGDDRWLPNKLERLFAALRAAPQNVVCVYSNMYSFDNKRRGVIRCPQWPVEKERRVRLLTTTWIYASSAMVLRSCAVKVKFPPGVTDSEDRIFWARLLDHGSILHVPEPLIEYRRHPHQQTVQHGHSYRAIASLWNWFGETPEVLSAAEREAVWSLLSRKLAETHYHAYWANDQASVEQIKSLYKKMAPQRLPLPPLFERDLPPLAVRYAHHLCWTLRYFLPPGLRPRAPLC